MREVISIILIVSGSLWVVVAALGIVRMPDLFLRMSATSKAGSFGVSLIMLGVAIDVSELDITTRALAVIAFIFLTAPVAAHMIGRAAYIVGVPLWSKTVCDELYGCYHPETHTLANAPRYRKETERARQSQPSSEAVP
ncbi:MAG: monovalent cation/H(+) antiporter subunit G [Chloroflexi bacterium AL-W]|nr:monovalent cation/H(+) antiporter subunit G [Chloroflexi bacterium AL-N1]NOK69643.1 monovalent cation/H(+) antiporter subunit G [Chloroflexi bacterium AL-N10]NOK72190.1 monovalent cation/H(+) antiporter subunit G [Chloroflexi bacterium AL-N5]NOK85019.1 monovalent cation/H(+) antiporter subunit G [Chloroflexi bacterium AL-W]NOK91772.1 monovalent cation/H(+) antiporter subunit G [Chloroflexi bacterium AL-N15]